MKYLSGLLLSLSLVTTVSADPMPPERYGMSDTGAQAIQFTDLMSGVDNSVFTLLLENAGLANYNTMGLYLYDTANDSAGTERFEIFSGIQTPNNEGFTNVIFNFDEELITRQRGYVDDSGVFDINVVTSEDTFGSLTSTATTTSNFYGDLATLDFPGFEIGLYLQTGDGAEFYSHDHLNPDEQRMVGIYDYDSVNGLLISWEDRIDGDFDYNDMVVSADDVSVVPAPTTLAIFGLALLGLASTRRKA